MRGSQEGIDEREEEVMKPETEVKPTARPWELKYPGAIYGGFKLGRHIGNVPESDVPHIAEEDKANAEFLIRAVNSYDDLYEFAKRHHDVCEYCDGEGKIWHHADPTSGQWVACPIAELLELDGAVQGGE